MLYFRKFYASAAFFALLLGAFSACMEVDVVSPIGRTGAVGDQGLSDLELWQQGVRSGEIPGDPNHLTVTDFFLYLQSLDTETGPAGTPGQPGRSAYEVWKEAVGKGTIDDPHRAGQKWPATDNDIPSYWRYLSGSRGANGATPRIAEDGYWYIGTENTNIKATGDEGEPGDVAVPPTITVQDGILYIDGTPTQVSVKPTPGKNGKDGKSHTLDIDPTTGNWLIDNEDSGVSAKGPDGHSPVVTINRKTGEWEIDGVPTGKTAFGKKGPKGDPGSPGKSAYEIWKEKVIAGEMPDPYDPEGGMWPTDMTSTTSFWEYLSGGTKYTVVAVPPHAYYPTEQIDRLDGSTTFVVQDYRGNNISDRATITNISLVHPDHEYSSEPGENGIPMTHIRVPRKDLTDEKPREERVIRPKIKVKGKSKVFASQKVVTMPNLIKIRVRIVDTKYSQIIIDSPYPYLTGSGHTDFPHDYKGHISFRFLEEYCVDGVWKPMPNTLLLTRSWLVKGKPKPDYEITKDPERSRYFPKRGNNDKPSLAITDFVTYRTVRLTEEMIKAQELGNDLQKGALEQYYWHIRGDDEWNHLMVVFGDGDSARKPLKLPSGVYSNDVVDFGDLYVFPDLMFLPPAELAPGVDTANKKVYIDTTTKEGEPILWGEFDKTPPAGYYNITSGAGDKDYDNYRYERTEENGLGIWKPKGGMSPYNGGAVGRMFIRAFNYTPKQKPTNMKSGYMFGNLYIPERLFHPEDIKAQPFWTNFYIKGVQDQMFISTNFVYYDGLNRSLGTPLTEYYGTIRYQLVHDATEQKWYLVNFWTPTEKWELTEKKWPGLDYFYGKKDENGSPRF